MKRTPLNETHKALGAKMVDYSGWEMPVTYPGGTVAEVKACRENAGLFDVSHMGEFRVEGPGALDFIQYITTNNAQRLTPGSAQYSLLLNDEGGTKDDIIVYREADDEFLVVVNAGCKDKDWDWFNRQAGGYEAHIADRSDDTALIAAQGPNAVAMVAALTSAPISQLKRFHFTKAVTAGVPCTISRTGYTGDDGCEIFCSPQDAPALWAALAGAGATPCGLSARDVLRTEAAYPLYGHELSETTSPLIAGLQWAIKTSKLDFIGREAIVLEAQEGPRQALAGLEMIEPPNAIAREGYLVFSDKMEEPVGRVTSGTLSPTLGRGIAMAILGKGFTTVGERVSVDIRGRRVGAQVVDLPFYRHGV